MFSQKPLAGWVLLSFLGRILGRGAAWRHAAFESLASSVEEGGLSQVRRRRFRFGRRWLQARQDVRCGARAVEMGRAVKGFLLGPALTMWLPQVMIYQVIVFK